MCGDPAENATSCKRYGAAEAISTHFACGGHYDVNFSMISGISSENVYSYFSFVTSGGHYNLVSVFLEYR